MGGFMDWARILAYITGTVDQELLLRNEYLAAENRILKAQLKTPLRLTDAERMTLAEIAHRLGRKALEDVANTAKPDRCQPWRAKRGLVVPSRRAPLAAYPSCASARGDAA